MTTTKHPQHRTSKRRNRAKRAAKKWAPAKSPAERAAAKTAAERVAAERVAAEQAAAAFNPPEQAQRRKSLACRFGWHHWESKGAEAQRFRECTQCGRHGWCGHGGGRDDEGDDNESWRLHDPGAGHAGNSGWFDGGYGGDGGDGGDGSWE